MHPLNRTPRLEGHHTRRPHAPSPRPHRPAAGQRHFVFIEKTLALRATAYAEADYTTWRGNAAGLSGPRANDRHGAGLTPGLMQKF